MKRIFKTITAVVAFSALSFFIYAYSNYSTPILMYHSLDKSRTKDYAAVSEEKFHKQMRFIKENNYKVIGLKGYCLMLKNKQRIPKNLIVLTFDDGYKDNLKAVKILKELGFPATIFIITENIGKPGYLSEKDIRYILNNTNITIGSHTITHPNLPELSGYKLKKEIAGSKTILENKFAVQIKTIAYPGGAFNQKTIEGAEDAQYLCACTTNRGFSKKLNLFALRRIKPTERDTDFTFWSKLSGFYNIFKKPKKPY